MNNVPKFVPEDLVDTPIQLDLTVNEAMALATALLYLKFEAGSADPGGVAFAESLRNKIIKQIDERG